MWSLSALCVLLSLVPGQNTGSRNHTEMYVRPGSDVLLPLSYNLIIDDKHCNGFEWIFKRSNVSSKISRSQGCIIQDYNNITQLSKYTSSNIPFSNFNTSMDGTVTLTKVTWKNSGQYNVTVYNTTGGSPVFNHTYTLHVQAPVSEPLLNVSCRRDGGADIICRTDTGKDLSFSIMVNKGLLLKNITSSKMVGNVGEVLTTAASPGPWDITCSVRNRVSDSETTRVNVTCPVPVSDPILEASCLHNGSLKISCSVENGTDPIFSVYVNGTLFSANVRKGMKRVHHVTVPSPDPWDVHCYVKNSLGGNNATTNITCPVPLSEPFITASCQNDRKAKVYCEGAEGNNVTYNWTINGELILWNTVPFLTINTSEFESGAINVSCSAENSISKTRSNDTKVLCDAPVSPPLLNVTCLSNGSAVITCSVLSGTNPKFQLTVNGKVLTPYNTSSSCCGYNYIMSSGGKWNISCSVGNELGKSRTSNYSHSWCGSKCSDCLRNSIIGGVVALIVTTSPLLIATYYIERNSRLKKP